MLLKVVFLGLHIVTPLISLDLLKYPKLCHDYFSLLSHMLEVYPEMVSQLNAEAFGHVMGTLDFGLHNQESQNTPGLQSSTLVSHECQGDQQNNGTEAPVGDSSSISTSSHGNRKVSWEDIEFYGRSWKKRMLPFRAYYIRRKLKKQIILSCLIICFNISTLIKYPDPPKVPLAHVQNGIHPMQEDSHVHDHSLLAITLPVSVGVGSCTNLFPADIL